MNNNEIEELYRETFPILVAEARKSLGVDYYSDAEDVAQDAFLSCLDSVDKYQGDKLFELMRFRTRDRAKNLIRDRANEVELVLQEDAVDLEDMDFAQSGDPAVEQMGAIEWDHPELIAEREGMITHVQQFITKRLGYRAWRVFKGVHMDGRTQAELAEEYGLDQPRISRILSEVQELIQEQEL